MKLGAVTMAYRDEGTIRGTLACLAPHVHKHVVFLQDRPYNGEYEEPDDTEAICNEFSHVEVVKGNWQEHVLRNLGIDVCGDCDWMIGFDADEMMTAEDFRKLKEYLGQTTKDAVGFRSKVYWRTPDYRFDPDPDHIKVCVVRAKSSARYYDRQCINCDYEKLLRTESPYITHHHLSYAWPKDILSKVTHYNHAEEFDGKKWYEEYYKNWKPGQPVYQPFGTRWEAVHDPLPDELKQHLKLEEPYAV